MPVPFAASAPEWRRHLVLLAASLAFGLLVYGLLPGWPIAMNDDFAYLRSIVETVRHGRPWTDDFLEPWAMSLSALCAGIFKLSGSFTLATVGLQPLLAAVSFWLAARLLALRGCAPLAALGLAGCLCTFPTLLWKQVEFTALVLYLPCLLAALWFAAQARWASFLAVWAVAVASRASALTWLLIPLVCEVEAAVRTRQLASLRRLLVIAILGAVWFLFLTRYANETHAQRVITRHIFSSANPHTVRTNLAIGCWIAAVAIGCATLLFSLAQRSRETLPAAKFQRMTGFAIAVALFASVPLVANDVLLSYEHPFFENTWAVGYLRGLVVVGGLGWLVAPPVFRIAHLVAAVASLGLASLRSELWDYYLIDGALIAFFAVRAGETAAATNSAGVVSPARRVPPTIVAALIITILGFQIAATAPLKRRLDHSAGMCSVLEKTLRAGWMKPTELSFSPFGFTAWHLFPYYIQHEGRNSAALEGFGGYVGNNSVDVQIQGVGRAETAAARATTDAFSEIHPRDWFGRARFFLTRPADPKAPMWSLRWEDYRYPIFPLNDAEWRQLASAPSSK
jgi:hypothetical protein